MSRRRRRILSTEDKELWHRYTKTTEKLTGDRPVPTSDTLTTAPATPPDPIAPRRPLDTFKLGAKARSKVSSHVLTPSISEQVAAAPLRMDAKAHKRMKAGKLRPEGKLDLHGMTLATAQPALTRFVMTAHADGKRLVLVVTGKGKSKPSDTVMPNRLGVLKHQVPMWLAMAPLSSVVLQVSEANRSHGGTGAYYVYLRRTR